MKFHVRSILSGVIIGAIVNTALTAVLAKLFGMNYFLAISLFQNQSPRQWQWVSPAKWVVWQPLP